MSGAAEFGSKYRGAQGLDPKFIAELNKQFGFDKPPVERFLLMLKNYLRFDFGKSYYRDVPVIELIKEKLPVSISLGIWMTLLSYLISIPLGVAKAVRDGSRFDVWTSAVVIVGYAIPSFLFAILLIVLFCGGSFWQIFPLRGLTSENFASLSLFGKAEDYLWHVTLPVLSLTLGAFATVTFLTKNSFLDEIRKQYVQTARMKGLSERKVLYGHVFRNAMMIVVAGFPGAFINAFFGASLLIETIFSLDGLGLLSYRVDRRSRLSGGVRQSLHFRAARAGRESFVRPHLHLDRSAHRFRDAGGLSYDLAGALRANSERVPRSGAAVGTPRSGSPHAAQPPPAWQLPPQPARILVAVDLSLFFRAVAICRVYRQRQADLRRLQRRVSLSDLSQLSGSEIRRLSRPDRLPRSVHRRRDQRARLHDLAADPLFLQHDRTAHCRRRRLRRRPGC